MANTSYLAIRITPVQAQAQSALGGAVKGEVIASGAIVSSAYYATVAAAVTATGTIANTYTVTG